jgi:hypothetical protein
VSAVALVSISDDGSKQSGNSNVTTSYDDSTGRYQIYIAWGVLGVYESYDGSDGVGVERYPNGALL